MTAPIIAGAEPWSADGTNGHGALVLHGFTGNPHSLRGLATALHDAGYTVELPLLPGHGTSPQDLAGTTWHDWSAAAEAVYQSLSSRVNRVVVAGLSMGGALTCWLASRHPEIAGIVCINPAVQPSADMMAFVEQMVAAGEEWLPEIAGDIADPEAVEVGGYDATPVKPLLSMFDAAAAFGPDLSKIACPLLLLTSTQDHVVPPTDSDHLAATVTGPVERVTLERSFHVATLDYDKEIIEEAAVAFAGRVTG
ncbi:MAG: alpha/beta fold hydrolase [Acidimicrobiales bacterium]|nr:alpha/beta fold hydrolase [Acidimicrobiales bacterium]